MVHFDSVLDVYRVSKYEEYTFCRSRYFDDLPRAQDRTTARGVAHLVTENASLDFPQSQSFNWADDVEDQLGSILDDSCSTQIGSIHEQTTPTDATAVVEQTAPTDATAVVVWQDSDAHRAKLSGGDEMEHQEPTIHHYNALGKPIFQASSTPPEVSLWFSYQQFEGLMAGVDHLDTKNFRVWKASDTIDPVSYSGDMPLSIYRGQDFLNAAKGYVQISYQPVGSWMTDEYPEGKTRPLEAWAPVVLPVSPSAQLQIAEKEPHPVLAIDEKIRDRTSENSAVQELGLVPQQPRISSALDHFANGGYVGNYQQQLLVRHYATASNDALIASLANNTKGVFHTKILEERDSAEIAAEDEEFYGSDAGADRHDSGKQEEQVERLQHRRTQSALSDPWNWRSRR